jgi:hypothetical protein
LTTNGGMAPSQKSPAVQNDFILSSRTDKISGIPVSVVPSGIGHERICKDQGTKRNASAENARFEVRQKNPDGSSCQTKEYRESQHLHTGLLTTSPEDSCFPRFLLGFPFHWQSERLYNFFDDKKRTLRDFCGQFPIDCVVRVPDYRSHVVQWRHRGGRVQRMQANAK